MSDDKATQRRPLVAANWKMYKTPKETEAFLKEFVSKFPANPSCDAVICPPFTSFSAAAALIAGTKIDALARRT